MLSLPLAPDAVLTTLEPWQADEFAEHVDRHREHLAPWIPIAHTVTDEQSASFMADAVWRADPSLQQQFPAPFGADADAWREWCAGVGVASGRLPALASPTAAIQTSTSPVTSKAAGKPSRRMRMT